MEKNKKYVRRSYFPHEYEKEEVFLSRMAGEGWHFVNLHYGIPTKYEFDKGAPIDYVYQLDYVTVKEDTEDYHSLFAGAGWEEVFSWNGVYDGKWYYFRKIRSGGKADRIFADSKSKYRMYDRLWKKYGLFFLLMLSLEVSAFRMAIDNLKETEFTFPSVFLHSLLLLLALFFTFWYVYLAIGMILKRNQLKNANK